MTVFDHIKALLDGAGVAYRALRHEPTRTSEASAEVRGEPLRVGAKAIVLKVGEEFKLFVISAAVRLDSRKVKRHFGVKKVRFATPDELMDLTGLVPGSVPPFGEPVLDLPLFVDPSILQNDRVAFNAGSLTDSIVMARADYIGVAKPAVLDFGER
jgi:prolyl-tRNA editing enzyme YbaK/EbsC (Cys-tRNA(Pro) deacylase)